MKRIFCIKVMLLLFCSVQLYATSNRNHLLCNSDRSVSCLSMGSRDFVVEVNSSFNQLPYVRSGYKHCDVCFGNETDIHKGVKLVDVDTKTIGKKKFYATCDHYCKILVGTVSVMGNLKELKPDKGGATADPEIYEILKGCGDIVVTAIFNATIDGGADMSDLNVEFSFSNVSGEIIDYKSCRLIGVDNEYMPNEFSVTANYRDSSKTITFKRTEDIKILTPHGDPSSGSCSDEDANATNEIAYDSEQKLKIECTAPGVADEKVLQWCIEDIGEIKGVWSPCLDGDSSTGIGSSPVVEFSGLPENNSDFGLKKITLKHFDYEGKEKDTFSTNVEVFFDATAPSITAGAALSNDNPPCWFKYWTQTSAGNPAAIYDNSLNVFGRVEFFYNVLKNSEGNIFWKIKAPGVITLGSSACETSILGGPSSYNSGSFAGYEIDGIENFYITLMHEALHHADFSSGIGKIDTDKDCLSDEMERTNGSGEKGTWLLSETDVATANTHGVSCPSDDRDSEFRAYKAEVDEWQSILFDQSGRRKKTFDSVDWSAGGKQWAHN
ncbi:MAG: hypothetical protein ACRC37_00635 [Lentisphaeria bacterium]